MDEFANRLDLAGAGLPFLLYVRGVFSLGRSYVESNIGKFRCLGRHFGGVDSPLLVSPLPGSDHEAG